MYVYTVDAIYEMYIGSISFVLCTCRCQFTGSFRLLLDVCLVSQCAGVLTDDVMIYDAGFPDHQPVRTQQVDGDGTVSTTSLASCRHFMTSAAYVNDVRAFRADHINLLGNENMIGQFLSQVVRAEGSVDVTEQRSQSTSLFDYIRNLLT